MTIEEQIFQRHRPDFNQLLHYGFQKKGDQYHFSQKFFENQFEADLTVDNQGHVSGKVVDASTKMEYLPLRAAHMGAFASAVQSEYTKLLKQIAHQCFVNQPFITKQANWLTNQIKQLYGQNPEFVFVRFPHTALFREPEFHKWYAVISDVKRGQLESNDPHGQGAEVDALNFRVATDQRHRLLKMDGVYPAYGTIKKNWLSVILDGTQSDQQILKLLKQSHDLLTNAKAWIIPANPKYFDIMHAFDNTDVIDWKQSANIRVGDTVFMYVTAPVKSVIYRCEVVKNNIPYNYQDKNLRINHLMKIKLVQRFEPGRFDLTFLRNHDVRYIRGPRHLKGEILKLLSQN